jgi:hypothetical protein
MEKGLRQRDFLLPFLFNIVAEELIAECWKNGCELGFIKDSNEVELPAMIKALELFFSRDEFIRVKFIF